jgi:hypothetical protein
MGVSHDAYSMRLAHADLSSARLTRDSRRESRNLFSFYRRRAKNNSIIPGTPVKGGSWIWSIVKTGGGHIG